MDKKTIEIPKNLDNNFEKLWSSIEPEVKKFYLNVLREKKYMSQMK